jgi:hypothetical protein
MNDFDENEQLGSVVATLLRRTAAVAEEAPWEVKASFFKQAPRRRHSAQVRRVLVITAVAAVTVAAVAIPLALRGGSTLSPAGHRSPPVDVTATPPGWSPVAYDNAQISVPSDWGLARQQECSTSAGEVFTGVQFPVQGCPVSGGTADEASIAPAPMPRPAEAKQVVVNGITAWLLLTSAGSRTLYVLDAPSLGVEVDAIGPLAEKVVHTLTYSPLSYVVGSTGAGAGAPRTWRAVTFGGIRFSVPSTWRDTTTAIWGAECGPPIYVSPDQVVLSSARRLLAGVCTNFAGPNASSAEYGTGVLVGAGPKATVWVGKAVVGPCLELSGLRSCVATSSEETDVLTLSIQVPGRTYPVVFELSLGRSGIPALEILDSIQAA